MSSAHKKTPPNYYVLLGIAREASADDIRRAYHRAARAFHPDMNSKSEANERFLKVQEAYEVLSNPDRRAAYDITLPPLKHEPPPAEIQILYSRASLLQIGEPQLLYALIDLRVPEAVNAVESPPLNVCLVLDRSTSMQGERLDKVKNSAIEIIRSLRPKDIFSIVTFSDRAEILIPSGLTPDLIEAETQIRMLRTGGGTEIFHGLETGFYQVRSRYSRHFTNHIILLTDGRTYGDEAACLRLAEQAAISGIGISGIGIGEEWNDKFLDNLAVRTGGSSMYIAHPDDINHFLKHLFQGLGQVYAERVKLQINLSPRTKLRYAFRISPDANPLRTTTTLLQLGNMLKQRALAVLLEFELEPIETIEDKFSVAELRLDMDLPGGTTEHRSIHLELSRPVTNAPIPTPPSTRILQAISRLTLYRMHEQAEESLNAGKIRAASRQLQNLATHLFSHGEKDLARAVLQEVENVRLHQRISEEGKKRIKYGTRALLLPASVSTPSDLSN